MKLQVNMENIEFFKCLSSKNRIKIIELLAEGGKNIGELAEILNVSSAIITRHINDLEKSSIISTESIPGKRGLQKVCSLNTKEVTLLFMTDLVKKDIESVSLPVGQYIEYEVKPTCGLASTEGLIGLCDDPRYFSSPDRFNAGIIWFQSGWIKYCIPGYIIFNKPIESIELSLELCSEHPGFNEEWPSDIYFYINDYFIGKWLSPGDFGEKNGVYTPEWWNFGTKYGLLKNIRITKEGTFLDGIKLSNCNLNKLSIEAGKDIFLKIASPLNTEHQGGLSLFGKGFGNYDQNIEVRVKYK